MMTAAEFATWIGSGDTGISSKSIAIAAMGGAKPKRGWGIPLDPSDFGRCARLIAKHPEIRKPAFQRLHAEGPESWRRLIERWDDIHECMDNEVGIDWSKGQEASRTYFLIKQVLSGAVLPRAGEPGE